MTPIMYAPPMVVPFVATALAAETGSAYVTRIQFPPCRISGGGCAWAEEVAKCAGCDGLKCSRICPYFSYSRIIKREWLLGNPKIMTGVGSMRLGGEMGADPNKEGIMSGGGDGERVVVSCFAVVKGDERWKS